MTNEQRERLKAHLSVFSDLDISIGELMEVARDIEARLEFEKKAVAAAYGVEFIGTCDECDRLLLGGDVGYSCKYGGTFCADHAPTWREEKTALEDPNGIYRAAAPEIVNPLRLQVKEVERWGALDTVRVYQLEGGTPFVGEDAGE